MTMDTHAGLFDTDADALAEALDAGRQEAVSVPSATMSPPQETAWPACPPLEVDRTGPELHRWLSRPRGARTHDLRNTDCVRCAAEASASDLLG